MGTQSSFPPPPGCTDSTLHRAAFFALEQGYAAASIEYRFSQKAIFPAQIQDCQAAIRWIRANAKKYNIDPNRIGVWGESAGDIWWRCWERSVTSMSSRRSAPSRTNPTACRRCATGTGRRISPPSKPRRPVAPNLESLIDYTSGKDGYSMLIGVPVGQKSQQAVAVSPVHYVTKDCPPFLIMHGAKDPLVPYAQSEELAEALRKAGVTVTLQKFPGAGHTGPAFHLPAARKLMQDFFNRYLKGSDVIVEAVPEVEVTIPPTKRPGT